MARYCIDIVTKSGKDIFYYVTSDKDLYKLFRQRMSCSDNFIIGLKSANGGKVLVDCREIAAVSINIAEQQSEATCCKGSE